MPWALGQDPSSPTGASLKQTSLTWESGAGGVPLECKEARIQDKGFKVMNDLCESQGPLGQGGEAGKRGREHWEARLGDRR